MSSAIADGTIQNAEPGAAQQSDPVGDVVIVAPELVEKPKGYSHTNIRWIDQPPKNPWQDGTSLSASAIKSVIFDMPIEVYYPGKCYCLFSTEHKITAAGTFTNVHENTFSPIKRLYWYTQKGPKVLTDHDNLSNHHKTVAPAETKYVDFEYNDTEDGFFPSNGTGQIGQKGQRPDGSAASRPFVELLYTSQNDTTGAAYHKFWRLNFGALKHLFIGEDKPFYLPVITQLRIEFHPHTKIGYTTTDLTSPVTGAADLAAADSVKVNNLKLMIAAESDQRIIQKVMDEVTSGSYERLFPYVTSVLINSSATRPPIEVTLDSTYGSALQRIYVAPYVSDESKNDAYNHSNVAGAKISSYQTRLNGKFETEFIIQCAAKTSAFPGGDQDWDLHKDMLRGSMILDKNMYKYNWFHCSKYDGLPNANDEYKLGYPKENLISGLPLTKPMKWEMIATTPGVARNYYMWIHTTKTMRVVKGAQTGTVANWSVIIGEEEN